MFSELWKRTKEVATMYTGTFVVVMILNQLLFFGFCLNPVCLIAAMPHVLFITVAVGTWLNKNNGWGNDEVAGKAIKKTAKAVSSTLSEANSILEELNEEIKENLDEKQKDLNVNTRSTKVNKPSRIGYKRGANDTGLIERHPPENEYFDYDNHVNKEPPSWLEEVPPWDEDDIPKGEPQWIESWNEAKIIEGLNQHGIFSIWHMTHKDNIKEILNKGIFSHTLAYKKTKPKDISDHDVQKWRESNDPIYDRKLHDYAATYINIKNPMLYVKRNIQSELCLIEISLSVLTNDNFIFCDGNAASRNTKFYNLVEDLEKLPWGVLNATYWNDLEDGKRKRCAEILIHPLIDPKYISKIHCLSHDTLEFISRFNVQSEITDELFFESEVSESKSNPFNDDIPF